ncbi:MAG: S8 family peptidase, partial [Syntrophales bacterium]
MYLSFESDPGFELKLDSLESARSGIELLTVRRIDEREWATVFVPAGKQTYFIKKVEDYRDKLTGKINNPLNQPLVDSISDIRKATLEGLWTDERTLFPGMGEEIWWEVWLRTGTEGTTSVENFKKFAPQIGLRIGEGEISFPERSILLVFGNIARMTRSLDLLNCMAEVRKAKDNPEIFMRMTPREQAEWVGEASERIRPAPSDDISVCLLDTGVNRSHPLIEDSLVGADMHAYDPAWGTSDHRGHGTEMAGLALYGDLVELFAGNMPVQLSHRLESVKILPPTGYGNNDPRLYGDITKECVARAEITAPHRKRVVSMAVTAPDFRDRGRPSSWSAAIDQMTSGAEDGQRRLLVLSAGNTDYDLRHLYPGNTEAVHDPGQAWNALCVGAYTEKTEIDPKEYPGWRPIAPTGDLSPSSCCSATWPNLWPIKPDIVMEGGNDAINPGTGRADVVNSLQLLTTNWRPASRLLTVT